MKVSKFTMIAMATILFAGLASASTVTAVCVPNPATWTVASGGGTEACAIVVALPVGAVVTAGSQRFSYSVDMQWDLLNTAGGAANWSFTGNNGGGVLASNPPSILEGGPGVLVVGGACPTCATMWASGAFVITDAFAQSAGPAGALQGATFSKAFSFDYTVPQGTPEPASFAMIGGGLLALGF